MEILELTNKLDLIFDKRYAYDFDNPGLNLLVNNEVIKNILITLDITNDVIEYAKKNFVNLIISHHPLIFNPIKNISNDCMSNKLKSLIFKNISVYSIHTNYDVDFEYGMGVAVYDKLNLSNIKSVSNIEDIILYENDNKGNGIGKIIEFNEPVDFDFIIEKLRNNLNINLNKIKVYSKYDCHTKFIKKVAILPGSGKGFVDNIISKNIDIFISSDLGHHDILDLYENGISYIDATHYGLEKVFMEKAEDIIIKITNINKENIFRYYMEDFN